MSFSAEVKENLSQTENFNPEVLTAELIGYAMSANLAETEEGFEFVTENEFNIEHFYKILFNLKIDYEAQIRGKCYVAQIKKQDIQKVMQNVSKVQGEMRKNIVKGAFLGAGSVNDPEKNYHLEIVFSKGKYADDLMRICEEFGVKFKEIRINERYQLYLKESEEISKFLALIGSSKAVLKFEDVRIMKERKNKINRKVNCETANLNKTIEAALKQIDDINLIKKRKKFDQLPQELKEMANLRLENPDLSLKDLSQLVQPPIGKSGVNRRLKKIEEFAEDLKKT